MNLTYQIEKKYLEVMLLYTDNLGEFGGHFTYLSFLDPAFWVLVYVPIVFRFFR